MQRDSTRGGPVRLDPEWRLGEPDNTCGPSSVALLDLHGGKKAVLFLYKEAWGNTMSQLRSFPCYSGDKEMDTLLILFLLTWASGAHSRHQHAAAHNGSRALRCAGKDHSLLFLLIWLGEGCDAAHVWRSEGQTVGAASLFLSCRTWGLNAGRQAWQQAAVLTEPSCQLHCSYFSGICFRLGSCWSPLKTI